MGWAWWLLAPLAATLVAALATWVAGRPRRAPTSEEAVSSHRRFLDDLADASVPDHRAVSSRPAASATANAAAARLDRAPGPTRTTGASGSGTERVDKLPE